MGCKRQFPFNSRSDCESHLLEADGNADACLNQPCKNKGVCVQLKYGGYRCECTGTGFYGQTCEQSCPQTPSEFRSFEGGNFPLECLLI